MSEVKVNKISPRSGTTVTLGDSGDTIAINSGVSLTGVNATFSGNATVSGDLTVDTNTLYVDSTNNRVGIGNSSPSSDADLLHVDSSGTNTVLIEGTGSKQLFSYHDTNGVGWAAGAGAGYGELLYLDDTNSAMRIFTNGSEAMRIDSSGHAIIPNGVTLGTAAGTYNAANTLDDYETGTWTPTLSPLTSGSITLKTAADKFSYTKIGDIVFLTGRIQVDSVSSPTGVLSITGLPFTTADLDDQAGIVHFPIFTSGVDFDTAMSSMLEVSEGGTTGIVLQQKDNAAWITLGANKVSANDYFTINGSYRVS